MNSVREMCIANGPMKIGTFLSLKNLKKKSRENKNYIEREMKNHFKFTINSLAKLTAVCVCVSVFFSTDRIVFVCFALKLFFNPSCLDCCHFPEIFVFFVQKKKILNENL